MGHVCSRFGKRLWDENATMADIGMKAGDVVHVVEVL